MRGLTGRDVGALADVGTDREERRVEAALVHRLLDVGHLAIQVELDPHVEDALNLGVEHVAGQPVLGDPEAHHPPRHRPRLANRHLVAAAPQVGGG